jgi:hypothetical protein
MGEQEIRENSRFEGAFHLRGPLSESGASSFRGFLVKNPGFSVIYLLFPLAALLGACEDKEAPRVQTIEEGSCDGFLAHLDACENYRCTYWDLDRARKMTRKIVRKSAEKCVFIEEVARRGDTGIECEMVPSQKRDVADFFRRIQDAKSVEVVPVMKEDRVHGYAYQVDGAPLKSPFDVLVAAKVCKRKGKPPKILPKIKGAGNFPSRPPQALPGVVPFVPGKKGAAAEKAD